MRSLALAVVLTCPAVSLADDLATLEAQVRGAYADVGTLRLAGESTMDVRYGGMVQEQARTFESHFDAGSFRYESADGPLLVSTAERTVTYDKRANTFSRQGATEQADVSVVPAPLSDAQQMLRREDPSLLLATTGGDLSALVRGAAATAELDVETDTGVVDRLSFDRGGARVTLSFDDATGLLVRREIDAAGKLEADGLTDVERAAFVVVYTASEPGAAVDAELFAWQPPRDAVDARPDPAGVGGAGGQPALALVGEAAPDFELPGLGGKLVALSDYAGQVVVLDFWATWCGPCVEGMPHLNRLALADDEIAVVGINQGEDLATVRQFLDDNGLTLPVLFDADQSVGEAYGVRGIPHTVVIDAEGVVREVLVGFGPETPEKLRAAVEAAKGERP